MTRGLTEDEASDLIVNSIIYGYDLVFCQFN
jgi:Fe-S cluster assembly scaffold protein SufB